MTEFLPIPPLTSLKRAWLVVVGFLLGLMAAQAQEQTPASASVPAPAAAEAAAESTMYIQEYRVLGTTKLPPREVEKAVYPFLGPERTLSDVDQARAALEKAYLDKGYRTVTVQVPRQNVKRGIIFLQVTEATVGRLRVHGSRYYDLERLKKKAPSLAACTVPNYNDVTRDIVSLNQLADLRVTPTRKPGLIPGTFDFDLNVQDTLPLHGSIEVNNRYSVNTTPWRINGGISYSNLWQLGHTLGFNFQIAPERIDDAAVYSAYYMLRFPGSERVNLVLQATKQDSEVSTLGGAAVAGRGETIGLRANVTLPNKTNFYHTVSFGIDYKNFKEDLIIAGETIASPVTYYPLSINYNANWIGKKTTTGLNAGVFFGLSGFGGDPDEFNTKRFNADEGFMYFRGDLNHTRELPGKFQAYAKVQGQVSSGPLINNEQFSGGGLSTVRGYLESAALGDNGLFGTLELRSPSILPKSDDGKNEWRFYGFVDAGKLTLIDSLPGQEDETNLASIGLGTRFRFLNHLNGSVDAGLPLVEQADTSINELLFTVRFWAEF